MDISKFKREVKFLENGLVYWEDNRATIVPTSSFGILIKDLYSNIGKERVKGFLRRYGNDLGRLDGKVIKEKFKRIPTDELIKIGPVYHQMRGDVIPNVTKIVVENHVNHISTYVEGTWEESFEAIEHIKQFGLSDEPVCHTLVGYASGFLTEVCNQTVLFKEISCVGKGDDICRFVGRTVDYWDEEMHEEMKYYTEEPIIKELKVTYEKLLEERNQLQNVFQINNRLTEEILKDKEIDSIMKTVYELTNRKIVFENNELKPIAWAGFSKSELEQVNESFIRRMEKINKPIHFTRLLDLDDHQRIITPVTLNGRINGYCSFVIDDEMTVDKSRFLRMIIERISSISAIYLLHKKTEIETEERLKGRFLEQILKGEYEKEDLLKKSNFIGINLLQPFHVVVIKASLPDDGYKEKFAMIENIIQDAAAYFQQREKTILIGQQLQDIVFLMFESELDGSEVTEICRELLTFLTAKHPEVSFQAGISMQGDGLGNVPTHFKEAQTAARMTSGKEPVMKFESLGILGPLIHSSNKEEIERIAENMLKPLFDHLNEEKSLEALRTIYAYLQNGWNLEHTAKELMLSMSGLRYRLRKIEELLGRDLRNPETAYQIYTSIQTLLTTGKLKFDGCS